MLLSENICELCFIITHYFELTISSFDCTITTCRKLWDIEIVLFVSFLFRKKQVKVVIHGILANNGTHLIPCYYQKVPSQLGWYSGKYSQTEKMCIKKLQNWCIFFLKSLLISYIKTYLYLKQFFSPYNVYAFVKFPKGFCLCNFKFSRAKWIFNLISNFA